MQIRKTPTNMSAPSVKALDNKYSPCQICTFIY